MSLELTELVKRPGAGKVGKPVRVRANFLEVTSFPTQNIHHYDVTIGPADTPPAVCRKVWKAFEDANDQDILNGIKTIFDGRTNVFSPNPLPLGEEQAKQFEVPCPRADKRLSDLFKIRIKKAGEVNMEELRCFLSGQSACTSNCLTAITVLNVLIRYVPCTLFHTRVSRSLFTPADKRSLSNCAEVWQGYYQSALPTVGKMMINIDVSASAFYESGPLHDIVAKILGRRSLDDLRRGIPDRDMSKLEKALKRLKIRVIHRSDKKPRYNINKLTPFPAEKTIFKDKAGNEMSVANYFVKKYNRHLNFPFLPCVVVKEDIFLPMEVCEVVPGQRHMKKLNEKQTNGIIKLTSYTPTVRANKIKQGYQLLQYRDNPYMQQFGMSVEQEMSVINARVLPTPKISYHASSQEPEFAPQGGAWNMRGKKVVQGATLGSWSVVDFSRAIPISDIQQSIHDLCQTFIDKGLNVVNRQPPVTSADPQGDIERTLNEVCLTAKNAANAEPQLIVCILPNTNVHLYAEIKRISDTVIGVPTQCLQYSYINTAANKQHYYANVCLKVNLKLGGMNWFLSATQIPPFIAQRPTIVIGADVTHIAPAGMNGLSIAALSASMDARVSRYSSVFRVQSNRTEIIADLANMVKEVLRNFYQCCSQKPERILFYRDGVSEGQFKQVMDSEVSAIRVACASLDKSYKPTLTFVVVQKRHHARFFPIEARDADRTGNCMPGTVVDTDIAHPFEFDFFLQSHAGIRGTSRPTHYCVVCDENKFTSDALQELTYRLCYIDGRTTRVASIIPAAHYAHLIAKRGRLYFRGENWFHTDATSQSMDSEAQMASFAGVKPDLQKVMYFM